MSKNRIKHQTLKNVLPENIKKEILFSMRQNIDTIACLFYTTFILEHDTGFEDDVYGDWSSGKRSEDINSHLLLAKTNLKLNNKLEGAFDKVSKIVKDRNFSPSIVSIKRNAEKLHRQINAIESNLFLGDFQYIASSVVALCYIFGGKINPQFRKKLGQLKTIDTAVNIFLQIEEHARQYKIISKMLSSARERVLIKQGDVFYNGKKYDKSNVWRISKNLGEAVKSLDNFQMDFSNYLYLYEDVLSSPIIIDDFIQVQEEMGYSQGSMGFGTFKINTKADIIDVNVFKFRINFISLQKDFVNKASVANIYRTIVHELVHSWQYHAENYDTKKYKSLMNGWTRYYNELSRIGMLGNYSRSDVIASQQREDFIEGLSDYIKVVPQKKFYKLVFLKNRMKPMFFYSKESMCRELVKMLTPTPYSMSNSIEFMAEVISMLSLGQKSPLGIGIDSDIATFYVPALRFIKLANRYGFNRF